MHRCARGVLLLAVLTGCLGCDRITKQLAFEVLRDAPRQSFWGDTIRLQYAENPGAFLGLGSSLPPSTRHLLLTAANGVLLLGLAGVVLVKWKDVSLVGLLAAGLVLSGGIGNLVDRCLYDGHVIDFLNLGVGPIRSGIFNVADVAITTGGLLWLGRMLRHERALRTAEEH